MTKTDTIENRVVRELCRRLGISVKELMAVACSPGITQHLRRLITNGVHVVAIEQARKIMGKNFADISVANSLGFTFYQYDLLYKRGEIVITQEELEACQKTHVLVAVPPGSIVENRQVMDRRTQCPLYSYFHEHNDGFHTEPFANERGEAEWWLIRKQPQSAQSIEDNQFLKGIDEVVPARVVDYAIFVFSEMVHEPLFRSTSVYCLDRLSDGRRVVINNINRHPMFLYLDSRESHPDVAGTVVGRRLESIL